jgi:ATP-binding cassette subfamily C protein CydC
MSLSLLALLANMGLLALSSWFIASMAIAGAAGAALEFTVPAAGVRALALARAAARYAERLVNHDATLRILSSLRVWFFRRIEPLAPARLAGTQSGDLLSRIRADVDTLDDFYLRGLVPGVAAVCAAACVLPFLWRFDPRCALIDLAGLACAGVLLPLVLRAFADAPGRERVALSADLRAAVIEQAQGMAELIALGAVEEHAARIDAAAALLDRRQRRLSSLQAAGDAGLLAAASLAVWATVVALAPRVSGGNLPGAQFAMLTVLILATFESVMPLPAVFQRAGEFAAAARRLFGLVDQEPAARDPAAPARAPAGHRALGLRVAGLRFRYPEEQLWVIDGLSLQVPAGGRLGISGPTGVGKSTLVSLLLRFWDWQDGVICVTDGATDVDLQSLRGDDARALFSVLPQSPHLFHASLRENLGLAFADGRESDEEAMRRALDDVQLTSFLSGLPDGLDTTVGETGRELSSGEARRVALARSLLREAPIHVLDEPTEGLDSPTADALLDAVSRRLRGRTLLVISHSERDFRIVDYVIRVGRPA